MSPNARQMRPHRPSALGVVPGLGPVRRPDTPDRSMFGGGQGSGGRWVRAWDAASVALYQAPEILTRWPRPLIVMAATRAKPGHRLRVAIYAFFCISIASCGWPACAGHDGWDQPCPPVRNSGGWYYSLHV